MPRGDRTGPVGQGPMTGRGMGYCAGYDTPGFLNRPWGSGGRGRGGFGGRGMGGGGFGCRHRYFATGQPGWIAGGYAYHGPQAMGPESELKALEEEASFLERSLEGVRKRLAVLRKREE